jgi:phosphoenolpyruvate carboxylase
MKSKLNKLIILLLGAFIMVSCSMKKSKEGSTILSQLAAHPTEVSVKSIVDGDDLIDVDLTEITPAKITAKKNEAEKKIFDLEIAKAKAAVYRFYSNVSLVNGLYESKLKSGKEINISDRLFAALSENLKQMNSTITKQKAEGFQVNVQEINSEYLNSLLRN